MNSVSGLQMTFLKQMLQQQKVTQLHSWRKWGMVKTGVVSFLEDLLLSKVHPKTSYVTGEKLPKLYREAQRIHVNLFGHMIMAVMSVPMQRNDATWSSATQYFHKHYGIMNQWNNEKLYLMPVFMSK